MRDELYEDAPCAHLCTRPDGTVLSANRTFLAWLGLPSESVVDTRFQSLLTVGSRIYYETHYAPLLQMQGFVNEIALEMRLASGDVRPVVASARQIKNGEGVAIENWIALFDSTDRRRYERELLQARKAAEQAASDLAAADKRKNQFIAMLAHELRNPLAPIRSAVEIVRQSAHANELLQRTSGILMRQVTRLTRLVDDLLDISRVGQDKLVIKRVPVDLLSVIYQAVETTASLFESAGIDIELDIPKSSVYIEADASRLAQAIENVLNNAAKFTPRGGRVVLALRRHAGLALISVSDTGIGIAPDRLNAVFDLFMQTGDSSRRQDGLGIGLTLAKTLTERHGGQITVESGGIGHGAQFTIRLPVLLEQPRSVLPAFVHQHDAAPTPSRRVLVVDDNADSAEMIALSLRFAGHDVEVALDGTRALARVSSFEPDVILLDIGLPEISGYEVAQRIRGRDGKQPRIVALTGWGQEEDVRRSAAAGFDAHLLKPVSHDELLRVVAALTAEGSAD